MTISELRQRIEFYELKQNSHPRVHPGTLRDSSDYHVSHVDGLFLFRGGKPSGISMTTESMVSLFYTWIEECMLPLSAHDLIKLLTPIVELLQQE